MDRQNAPLIQDKNDQPPTWRRAVLDHVNSAQSAGERLKTLLSVAEYTARSLDVLHSLDLRARYDEPFKASLKEAHAHWDSVDDGEVLGALADLLGEARNSVHDVLRSVEGAWEAGKEPPAPGGDLPLP